MQSQGIDGVLTPIELERPPILLGEVSRYLRQASHCLSLKGSARRRLYLYLESGSHYLLQI